MSGAFLREWRLIYRGGALDRRVAHGSRRGCGGDAAGFVAMNADTACEADYGDCEKQGTERFSDGFHKIFGSRKLRIVFADWLYRAGESGF